MKKKLLAIAAIATGAVVLSAAPSSAAQVCYDVQANLNGTPVAQAGCIPLG